MKVESVVHCKKFCYRIPSGVFKSGPECIRSRKVRTTNRLDTSYAPKYFRRRGGTKDESYVEHG